MEHCGLVKRFFRHWLAFAFYVLLCSQVVMRLEVGGINQTIPNSNSQFCQFEVPRYRKSDMRVHITYFYTFPSKSRSVFEKDWGDQLLIDTPQGEAQSERETARKAKWNETRAKLINAVNVASVENEIAGLIALGHGGFDPNWDLVNSLYYCSSLYTTVGRYILNTLG